MGLLLHAIVHSAGIQDRDGGIFLLATMKGLFPFLEKLFADAAYQGPLFANGLAKILPRLETEIVKRSDHAKGFVQLPKRERVVEIRRTRGFTYNPWRTGSRFIISHSLLADETYAAGLRDVLGEFRSRALVIL